MRDSYRSLKQEGRSGYTDRKSEFIGIAKPVETGAEAEEFVAAVRAEFPDARHHVYAWITGGDEVLQKYSDDGEPRGTGGLPVLDVLLHQNLEDAAVVVVRYFGGILLGTGGLVRAYSSAAAQAVEAAVPIFRQKLRIYKLITPYTLPINSDTNWLSPVSGSRSLIFCLMWNGKLGLRPTAAAN